MKSIAAGRATSFLILVCPLDCIQSPQGGTVEGTSVLEIVTVAHEAIKGTHADPPRLTGSKISRSRVSERGF